MEHPRATPALFEQEPYLNRKLTVEKFQELMMLNNHELEFESIDWSKAEPLVFAAPASSDNLQK